MKQKMKTRISFIRLIGNHTFSCATLGSERAKIALAHATIFF